jgi:hypothetical protein
VGVLLEGLSVGFCEDAHVVGIGRIDVIRLREDTVFLYLYIVLGDVLDGIFKSFRPVNRQLQKRGSETYISKPLHRPLRQHAMFLAHHFRQNHDTLLGKRRALPCCCSKSFRHLTVGRKMLSENPSCTSIMEHIAGLLLGSQWYLVIGP